MGARRGFTSNPLRGGAFGAFWLSALAATCPFRRAAPVPAPAVAPAVAVADAAAAVAADGVVAAPDVVVVVDVAAAAGGCGG